MAGGDAAGAPAGATPAGVHAHPAIVRLLANAGVAFGAASLLVVLALPFARPGEVHWVVAGSAVVFLVAVLVVGVKVSRRSHDTIEVTAQGLWRHSPGEASAFVAWGDVGSVEAQNVLQRLVVRDRSGATTIALEYHLERFGELRRVVLEKSGLRAVAR